MRSTKEVDGTMDMPQYRVAYRLNDRADWQIARVGFTDYPDASHAAAAVRAVLWRTGFNSAEALAELDDDSIPPGPRSGRECSMAGCHSLAVNARAAFCTTHDAEVRAELARDFDMTDAEALAYETAASGGAGR